MVQLIYICYSLKFKNASAYLQDCPEDGDPRLLGPFSFLKENRRNELRIHFAKMLWCHTGILAKRSDEMAWISKSGMLRNRGDR